MAGHVKAWQSAAAGLVIPTRAAILKVLAFHSTTADEIVKFYDFNRAATESDIAYEWHLYAKGQHELDMPLEGVIFECGIYVVPSAHSLVTVFYRGV